MPKFPDIPSEIDFTQSEKEANLPQEIKIIEKPANPENKKSDVPVVFAPGWGLTAQSYNGVLDDIAKGGHDALTVDSVHGLDEKIADDFLAKLKEKYPDTDIDKIAADISKTTLVRAAAYAKMLDEKGIEKATGFGFSQGGLDIIALAMLDPQRFENIVLLNPAGLVEKHSQARLAVRAATNAANEQIDFIKQKYPTEESINKLAEKKLQANLAVRARYGINPKETDLDELKEYAKEEILEKAKENMDIGGKDMAQVIKSNLKETLCDDTKAISQADISKDLEKLREMGIGIAVLHNAGDEIFPTEKIFDLKNKEPEPIAYEDYKPSEKYIKKRGAKTIAGDSKPNISKNSAYFFIAMKGRHNQAGVYQDGWTEMVNFAVEKLEEISKKIENAPNLADLAEAALDSGTEQGRMEALEFTAQMQEIVDVGKPWSARIDIKLFDRLHAISERLIPQTEPRDPNTPFWFKQKN